MKDMYEVDELIVKLSKISKKLDVINEAIFDLRDVDKIEKVEQMFMKRGSVKKARPRIIRMTDAQLRQFKDYYTKKYGNGIKIEIIDWEYDSLSNIDEAEYAVYLNGKIIDHIYRTKWGNWEAENEEFVVN